MRIHPCGLWVLRALAVLVLVAVGTGCEFGGSSPSGGPPPQLATEARVLLVIADPTIDPSDCESETTSLVWVYHPNDQASPPRARVPATAQVEPDPVTSQPVCLFRTTARLSPADTAHRIWALDEDDWVTSCLEVLVETDPDQHYRLKFTRGVSGCEKVLVDSSLEVPFGFVAQTTSSATLQVSLVGQPCELELGGGIFVAKLQNGQGGAQLASVLIDQAIESGSAGCNYETSFQNLAIGTIRVVATDGEIIRTCDHALGLGGPAGAPGPLSSTLWMILNQEAGEECQKEFP